MLSETEKTPIANLSSQDINHLTRLAQVAKSTASTVIITDVQGLILWVNAGFTRLTGYSLDEAIGHSPGKLLQGPNTDRAEIVRIGLALRAQKGVAAELINYAKDGRQYWLGMKIEPLINANGDIEGFMAIEADITERHERNQALELMTQRFNMATRAAHIGVYERSLIDEDIWWSDEMWAIMGQDRATFCPSTEAWMELIHPEDREHVHANAGGPGRARTTSNLQYRVIRPDGAIRHVESIASKVETRNSGPGRMVGMLLDVTERVEYEARERVLQHQLRESSHQAGMAEIATGVLHNVGNVLNSLGIANTTARRDLKALRLDRLDQATSLLKANRATLAEFLSADTRGQNLPDYLPALSAQIAVKVQTVQAELDTTDGLLHHLRDIVSAQQTLAHIGGLREPVSLLDLVESALLVQAPELALIEVVRQYDNVAPVITDRHKLLQILVNLVSNARDAVRASTSKPGRIIVRLAQDADHAMLSIEDSGIGMTDDVLGRLWRFGFTTKPSGHGFGLHNSATAAREIGATLTAHSAGPGQGSRLTITLPVGVDTQFSKGAAA